MSVKYTICLCDDDSLVRSQLKNYILQYGFKYNIDIKTYELNSAKRLLDFDKHYDILFLDIRFNNEDIGINIAEKLRLSGNTAIIVLITSYESLSIDGYRAEPFRFVLKPYTKDVIEKLLDSCIAKMNRSVHYISVTSESNTEMLRTNRIIYIYSKKRQRHVVCDDTVIVTWQSLMKLMENLPQDIFTYSHKSYIINVEYINTISNNVIKMSNGINVPVSEHYKNELMKVFAKNIKNTSMEM